MALNIISNFAANVAHRNLVVSDREVSSSIAKLSAGSRVISAKDDAASLAIGSRLNAEVQAQRQAMVNANQASSMLQIADGAMAKVNDILVRMKTLAVQSGSGQLATTERTLLDTEFQALLSEIDRIAQDTEFNGVTLINGSSNTSTSLNSQSASTNVIQAADGVQSIAFDSSVSSTAFSLAFDAATDNLTVTNLSTGVAESVALGSTAIAQNATQVAKFGTLGVTITLNQAFDKTADVKPTGTHTTADTDQLGVIETSSIKVTLADSSTGLINLDSSAISVNATVASAAVFTVGTFTGSVDLSSTGTKTVLLNDTDASVDFTISFNVTTGFVTEADASTLDVTALGAIAFGQATTGTTTSFTFKLGTGNVANVDDVTLNISAVSVSALSLTGDDVLSVGTANTASTNITAALDTLNTARSGVGASQNRLEFAADNLASTIENSEAARSALMDLDVAEEMTTFTSKLILVQAGVAMLSQANNLPQNLLQLFQ
jgi:flagellin